MIHAHTSFNMLHHAYMNLKIIPYHCKSLIYIYIFIYYIYIYLYHDHDHGLY